MAAVVHVSQCIRGHTDTTTQARSPVIQVAGWSRTRPCGWCCCCCCLPHHGGGEKVAVLLLCHNGRHGCRQRNYAGRWEEETHVYLSTIDQFILDTCHTTQSDVCHTWLMASVHANVAPYACSVAVTAGVSGLRRGSALPQCEPPTVGEGSTAGSLSLRPLALK